MRRRLISPAFLLIGLLLLALARVLHFMAPSRQGIFVAPTAVSLTDCVLGKETELVFCVQNNAGHPIRLVGQELC